MPEASPGNWNKSNKEFCKHMEKRLLMFLTFKNIPTAEGLIFPSLSVHCIGNNEAFYFLVSVVGDR